MENGFTKYQQILKVNVTVSQETEGERDWVLQQDSDPKHTSKFIMNYFKKCKLNILE